MPGSHEYAVPEKALSTKGENYDSMPWSFEQ